MKFPCVEREGWIRPKEICCSCCCPWLEFPLFAIIFLQKALPFLSSYLLLFLSHPFSLPAPPKESINGATNFCFFPLAISAAKPNKKADLFLYFFRPLEISLFLLSSLLPKASLKTLERGSQVPDKGVVK